MSEKSIKGAINEHIAIVELMKNGYYVSTPIDPQSPFDIVVVSPKGKIEFIDVKSISRRKKNGYKIARVKSKNQKKFIKDTGLNITLRMQK